ncbi:hypothetical protein [Novosphingobium album (ex Hu et al. 2023)]|uniref:Uncharacterized protein n=1 Tax=Novosphingobium album (ex Hu et al. 2023) TaxID=2930093 RepID=A0ABT0B0K6_9SPHN|nr:hypothetical protein [Novosphingobium album (ex Hu et al. 2023)]MCJ2178596.1 hypothetical protein [Novosphingobium album (ex Hu et al. 2023)]
MKTQHDPSQETPRKSRLNRTEKRNRGWEEHIPVYAFPAFTMICALWHSGFKTPYQIISKTRQLSGDAMMLDVAHVLRQYGDGPVALWPTNEDGTLDLTIKYCHAGR